MQSEEDDEDSEYIVNESPGKK